LALLLTGCESFVGRELKKTLSRHTIEFVGWDVVPSDDANCLMVDIRDKNISNKFPDSIDCIIHLAAISRELECSENPLLAFDVNVQGTLNLVEVAKSRSLKQFIFASSEWVYGEVLNEEVQIENQVIDVTRIMSNYALSKICGERALEIVSKDTEMAATILRFSIIYGPRTHNWSAVEALFNTINNNDEVVVGSLKTARRFIHISDICEGIFSALNRTGFEVLNLSGSKLTTLGKVIETAIAITGKSPEIVENSPDNIRIRNPDNTKALKLLKWKPKITLENGMQSLLGNL
jgi:nucleoside-diphosphate-sugar epimerase